MSLAQSTFRCAAFGVGTAALVGVSTLSLFSASADEAGKPFTPQQCSNAISIANTVVHSHKGRLSSGLIDSFVRFGKSKCDLNTDWKISGKADEQAFGEFRVLLVAMRSAQLAKPQALARQ